MSKDGKRRSEIGFHVRADFIFKIFKRWRAEKWCFDQNVGIGFVEY